MAPRSHLFQGYRWFSAFMVYIVLSLASIDSVVVTVETPWFETTNAQVDFKSVENFNGLEKKDYPEYKTNFDTGYYTGVYHHLSAAPADFYGGAGGTGLYAYNQKVVSVELKINKTDWSQNKPLNYFGLSVSALKKKDQLIFLHQKRRIFGFSLELIYNKVYDQSDYWYNQHFKSATRSYAFVFINFFFDDGEYDEVHFASDNDWFCSDNHSFGSMGAISGTEVYRETLTPPPEAPRNFPITESRPKRGQFAYHSSSTTTKAELIPFICIAWITIDVILATVALE